jgi:uncharacterized membrane protein
MPPIVRVAAILVLIYMSVRLFMDVRKGELRIGEEEPTVLITRYQQPRKFWSHVVGFYLILVILLAMTAFQGSF